MTSVTREEFASGVAAAISSVHHLYREVNGLIVGLRDALAEEPNPLTPVRGTWPKGGRKLERLVLRYEYAVLFGPAEEEAEDEIEEEDEEDDAVDDPDEEDGTPRVRKLSPVGIESDQPLLAMRIAMYDPQEGFEPHIAYAVMSDWAIGTKPASTPAQPISLAGYMLRRIPRVLGASTSAARGARVMTRARAK